ncbi:MAG: transposase, partial [Sphingomonadales bacterium]|nr:transposase [Sphingomonadales bacterium]
TGSPWRDLPALFGNWCTAFRRFRDRREADVFKRIFDALSEEPDMVDATIVKVHRHGQGAKGDSKPGHRPFQRRHDDQDSGADRCLGQSCPLRTAAGEPRRRTAD